MVRLDRIVTRGGDKGETSLADGSRRPKNDARITACGSVDETNATIGLARLHATGEDRDMLARIQNDLFDLGADLSTPGDRDGALRIRPAQTARLEQEITRMNAQIAPLTSFILPGGTPLAASLHFARTVARRAERDTVALARQEDLSPHVLTYLNRLSDHLFVMSRHANAQGRDDILWVPGANSDTQAGSE